MHPRWVVDPSSLVPLQDVSGCAMAADEVVQMAVNRAVSVVPDLEVSAEVLAGPTVGSLVRAGSGARLLVLGHHGPHRGALRGLLPLSVCGRVAAHARCPVVVVKRLPGRLGEGMPPRVVVGVDGTASSTAALGFAFRAAAQRDLPVTAVHAWTPDRPADLEAVSGPVAGSEARARAALDQGLAPWRHRFVDVAVEPRLICGDPAAALIRESEGAALIVVGSRGRGALRMGVFGSVSRRVALRARCPAVVVRPDETVTGRGARAGRRTVVPRAERATQPTRHPQTPWA
jgi:nucleotide-binding universal stress UspA family protein